MAMTHSMNAQLFYRALQRGNDLFINGYFYNARFFEGRFPVGQIDDDGAFRYFASEEEGRPAYPEHVAGHVEGLMLVLSDGTIFDLIEVDPVKAMRSTQDNLNNC